MSPAPRVIDHEQVKANMRAVLSDIQDGSFAGRWIAENKNGRTFFNSKRAMLAKHPLETVGSYLRDNMLWKNNGTGDADLTPPPSKQTPPAQNLSRRAGSARPPAFLPRAGGEGRPSKRPSPLPPAWK